MATLTTIVTGRIGDGYDSTVDSVANEDVTSSFDVPVKLQFKDLVAGSVNVEDNGGGVPYTENVDYTVDYSQGYITVLSSGGMADATVYDVDYDYTDGSLAVKVNAITTAAQGAGKTIYKVIQVHISERMGAAIIVYQA